MMILWKRRGGEKCSLCVREEMLWERKEKMLWERRAGIGRVDRESDPPSRPQQMTWGKHHSRHHQFMSLACLGGFMAIRYGKEGVSVPPSTSMEFFFYIILLKRPPDLHIFVSAFRESYLNICSYV